MTLQIDRLKKVLHYDPNTGVFTWLQATANRISVGAVAGALSNKGYVRIQIDRKIHPAHRLAWLYTYGVWPKSAIDHINHVKTDNRIVNLREATPSENARNSGLRRDNKWGYKGVSYWARKKKWAAQIRIDGKNKLLGVFVSPEDAGAAYAQAVKLYGLEM